MARIRTIKPEFFRHHELFEAEKETGLPIRLAFAGLWTSCDREGRFKWKPEELKLDSLPYDVIDFPRVLDVLWTRGFIEKYTSEGRFFGFVPSWNEHQHINNRESESIIPNPCECEILTRDGRVTDASEKLQRGKEGKGKERKGREYTPDILSLNDFCFPFFDEKYLNDNSLDMFDKLINIDKYTTDQIKNAIKLARGDEFWDKNFVSPLKLRDKDKNKVLFIDRFLKIKPNGTHLEINNQKTPTRHEY